MRKQTPLRIVIVVALGAWLLVAWATQPQVNASQTTTMPPAMPQEEPLQQSTCTGPGSDLAIGLVTFDPVSPVAGDPYNVRVEIINTGTMTVTEDSWAGVYLGDRPPADGGAPDFEDAKYAFTAGLITNTGSVVSILTIPDSYATVGWHQLWVEVNVRGRTPRETECAGGEGNNVSVSPYVINIPSDAPPTPEPPTATPFPPPQIYRFSPGDVTIVRGDSVVLDWQVYGDSVGVTLDGAPVPMEDTREMFPTTDHVYTLRAENPGGVVQDTCRITVVDPTPTPTPTPLPCALPIIHEFNATKTSIVRGDQTTLYWDLSGATAAYLDGSGVSGVSEKTVTLYQTTIFSLRAVNGCGEAVDTLQITVRYATPTPTRTPTRTPTPTYNTPRPPTATPTRNVLPTPTWTPTTAPTIASTGTITTTATPDMATPPTVGPQVPTITPGVTGTPGTFDSPLGTPTPGSGTVPTSTTTIAPTEAITLATALTNTVQPEPTGRLATVTPMVNTRGDLSITKTDDPDPVVAGTTLTYALAMHNNGLSDVSGVVVTDTLPSGVAYSPGASSPDCTEAGGIVTCTIGTLSAGGDVTRTLVVTVDADTMGTLTNTAVVAGNESDPAPGNNSMTIRTTVTTKADLSIAKTDDPGSGVAGTMRMYLCPLGILIVFALSVLVLSVVVPRIREHREAQEAPSFQPADTVFDPGAPLVASRPAPARAFSRAPVVEDPVTIEINDLIPRRQSGSSMDDSVSIEINDRATIRRP